MKLCIVKTCSPTRTQVYDDNLNQTIELVPLQEHKFLLIDWDCIKEFVPLHEHKFWNTSRL